MADEPFNRLYYGDCLTIMSDLPAGSVDLIYLDPPFNSNRQYNAIYRDETGRPLPEQVEAFSDTWELDEVRLRSLRELPIMMRRAELDDATVEMWQAWSAALRRTRPRLLAYLSYMLERLLVMRQLLKPTGSIFLHCDPTASHYLKILMDSVFGHNQFRNEIIWRRTNAKGLTTVNLASNHDVILRYSKTGTSTWHPQYADHDPDYVEKFYKYKEDGTGRRYQLGDLTNPNKDRPNLTYEFLGITRVWRWTQERMQQAFDDGLVVQTRPGTVPRLKRYLDEQEGNQVDDLWTDIGPVQSQSDEDMGYDTQKPLDLLERIIAAASDPGDVVLDPFCGCATTIEAAERLGRRWIGIDIAIHAVKRVAKVRLGDRCRLVDGVNYRIEGVPQSIEGARDLVSRDAYQFQKWAVEQVDGFVTSNRTADGGIDGRLYFAVPGEEELQSMVIEVKGGAVASIRDLRSLRGVLDVDSAQMAGFIVMGPVGQRQMRNFREFMAEAGDYEVLGIPYPRMQLLTVQDILDGKHFHTPGVSARGSAQRNLPLGT